MEQLVARRAHNPKVTGSSPVPATLERGCFGILFLFQAFMRIGAMGLHSIILFSFFSLKFF